MRPLTVAAARGSTLRRARREARPRCARYFCSRSATPAGVGRGRGMDIPPVPSGLVGRRRRHEARGGIARRGQFFVVGVVVRRGIELVGAVLGRRAPGTGTIGHFTGIRAGVGSRAAPRRLAGGRHRQRQLQVEIGERLDVRERRQVFDGLEREVVEELGRGA